MADKKIKYQILYSNSLSRLTLSVNDHLSDGWQLQGGVSVGLSKDEVIYVQAVIKYEDADS